MIILIILIIMFFILYSYKKLNKRFYNYKCVYPYLEILKNNRYEIMKEYIKNTSQELWKPGQNDIYIKVKIIGI